MRLRIGPEWALGKSSSLVKVSNAPRYLVSRASLRRPGTVQAALPCARHHRLEYSPRTLIERLHEAFNGSPNRPCPPCCRAVLCPSHSDERPGARSDHWHGE